MSIYRNIQDHKERINSIILIVFMIIGLCCGAYLVQQRIDLESQQNHVENIMNYDDFLRHATFEKRLKEALLKEAKESGITAFAIYDRTLEKMKDNGDVIVLTGDNTGDLYLSDTSASGTPGKTYILPVLGKEDLFRETLEALQYRLGANKVVTAQTNRGLAIILDQPYTALKSTNLSISRVQAREVIESGFNVIVRPTNYPHVTKEDVDFTLKRIAYLPRITGMVFVGKEALGYPHYIGYVAQQLQSMRIPLVGIESTSQLQYEPQEGFMEMAQLSNYKVGRLYTISDDYLKKLKPERVSQMFYISDLERNVRFNLLPIFKRGFDNKTSLESSLAYAKDLKEKLESRDMELGRASIYPSYKPSLIPLMGTLFGAVALLIFTMNQLVRISLNKQGTLFIIITLGTIIAYVFFSNVMIRQIWALITAIMAPTNGAIFVLNYWKKRFYDNRMSRFHYLIEGVLLSVLAFAISLLGGVLIGAILGSTDFFMEFNIYRGVKLTFILPIIFVIIAYFERFPLWKGNTVRTFKEAKVAILEFLNSNVKVYTILALGVIAIVGWIFIGRSGHTANVPVPNFEVAMRHYLENIMYARPREKEFLIGYPALLLGGYFLLQRIPLVISFLTALGTVIGLGSMVETFAHIRTPIYMSLVRGVDGLWVGLIVGLIGLFIYWIGESIYKSLREDPYE